MATNHNLREEVWDYLQKTSMGLKLIDIAASIAQGNQIMPPSSSVCVQGTGCPHPLNFLANAEPPSVLPIGIPSRLPAGFVMKNAFTGSNFTALAPMVMAKSSAGKATTSPNELRGFNSSGLGGLAILLGPWTDYCLWCWSLIPFSDRSPTIIFGKDNSTLAEENVVSGVDWGAQQAADSAKATLAKDKSTRRLFGSLEKLAVAKGLGLTEFIAQERIIVVNIWPWFRCGVISSGDQGVHANFGKVPALHGFLADLVRVLHPSKILCAGSWSWNTTQRPLVDNWITQSVRSTGCQVPIRSTLHPSARFWSEPDFLRLI